MYQVDLINCLIALTIYILALGILPSINRHVVFHSMQPTCD